MYLFIFHIIILNFIILKFKYLKARSLRAARGGTRSARSGASWRGAAWRSVARLGTAAGAARILSHRRTHPNPYCGQKFGRHFLLFKNFKFYIPFEHISLNLHNRKYA